MCRVPGQWSASAPCTSSPFSLFLISERQVVITASPDISSYEANLIHLDISQLVARNKPCRYELHDAIFFRKEVAMGSTSKESTIDTPSPPTHGQQRYTYSHRSNHARGLLADRLAMMFSNKENDPSHRAAAPP